MSWSDVFKVTIPVVVVVLGWLLNEYSKRQWERYKRKEDRYVALVESLEGFYVSVEPTDAKEKKEEFLRQLRLCWLYCPDTVIHTSLRLSESCQHRGRESDIEKERALVHSSLS